jgi:glycosyltransferase involved in cell wall biosynthesis
MRILQIIPNLRKGGAERLVIDITNELSRRSEIETKLILFEDIIEYDVSDIEQLIVLIPSSVQLSVIRKPVYNTSKLQEFIEKYQPDIIHSHLFQAEIISRSCFYPKAQWFSHCHDNMIQFQNLNAKTFVKKKLLTNYFEKRYLFKRYSKNRGNHFIAISKDTKTYFEKNTKPYPVTLLSNAINYNRFCRASSSQIEPELIHLVNVGSFQDKKNQAFLIDLAEYLKRIGIAFKLHFAGSGKNRQMLEEKVQRLQLQNEVIFHGNVEDVEQLLWQSTIYVHSATYEPFGLVLLEAMAAGLPVICLDGGGNRDIMENGKNGYILPSNATPEEFSEKIKYLMENPELYQEMSKYAQEYAQKFDIVPYADKLLNIYSEALAKKSANAV